MRMDSLAARFCLLTIITTIFITGITAQDTSNTIGRVSIASPTAASLGKFGDIPVSYHTGLPQISIPVYTVKSSQLSLPVSLSYHASGLKVQEQAGWVGAGWSLNAGGVITRTVIGAPDDRGNAPINNVTHGHYSDYGFNNYLISAGVPDDLAFSRGYKDGEPDLYFFNFGGYTGKFYFNDDRTPVFVPEQDFKVQPDYLLGPGFQGFTVTVPTGVKYYFGKTGNNGTVNPIESTTTATVQNGVNNANAAASSWYLNKIVSADAMDSITLTYLQESYSYYTLSMSPVLSLNYNQNVAKNCGYNLVKNFTTGVRLSQIKFPAGTVTFNKAASPRKDLSAGSDVNSDMTDVTNTSAYALGSIQISDNNGFCKKDSLYYGYFYDSSASDLSSADYGMYNLHSDTTRLRLDSIQEFSCDATVKVPPYKFSYFAEQVPSKLSFGIDHWGFYNGVTNNTTLVPTYTVTTGGTPTTHTGAGRDAVWPAMRGGTLQKINYPTGGTTTFDFESHDTYVTSSSYLNQVLQNMRVNQSGASAITQTVTFNIVSTGGDCNFTMYNRSTNYQPTFYIKNGAGQIQGSGPWLLNQGPSTFTQSLSLPAGTYTATLYFPAGSAPTGGADGTIYQWQTQTTQSNVTVGGLRIKTITSNDGVTANDVITSFNYAAGGSQSTGVLYSRPTYVQVIRNDNLGKVWPYCSPNGCASCDGVNAHNYYVSPAGIQPMAATQGQHIGYDEVQVSQANSGKSIYRYYGSNIWGSTITDVCTRNLIQSSACDPSIPNFPAAPLPFEFMRGELKYEGAYNQAGQVLKETYHYPVYTSNPLPTPGHISVNIVGLNSYTEYNLQSGSKVKDSTISIAYDPATSTSLTTQSKIYYSSAFHHQPTRTVVFTSTGDSLVTNTKYAFDFRASTCDAIPDSLPYYLATSQANLSWMNSNISSCTPQVNNSNNCRLSIFTQYRVKQQQARAKFLSYRRRSYTDPNNLLYTCFQSKKSTADAVLKPVLQLQDEYINAPIETSQWKNTDLLHASYINFAFATNPSAYVYPVKSENINLTAASASFINAAVSGNTITKDSRYLSEQTAKYNLGNVIESRPRNGAASSYIWDYKNSLPVAAVTNATSDQVAYTSFEADGKGGWACGAGYFENTAPTGKMAYDLVAGGIISKAGLNAGATYVLSYWSNAGDYNIYSGSTQVGGTPAVGKTINGWTYYEHKITGVSNISIYPYGQYILGGQYSVDELRLYPSTAQMTTYTYQPLLGITAQCDAGNRITYYEYDGLGRLQLVRDQDRNIIKKICYNYSGQVTACAEGCTQFTCSGPDKKCVNGNCETAQQVFSSSVNQGANQWLCTYHYQWSDGSVSRNYQYINSTQCEGGIGIGL